MRLLCIANPAAYAGTTTDVPLSYARLAAHPDIELFHADTQAMMAPHERIRATRIPTVFMPHEFGQLSQRELTLYPPKYFDVAFCRTLKPFPKGYLKQLTRWSKQLLFVNNPAGIKRQLQPMFFLTAAGELTPPSVLTADETSAFQFLDKHRMIVAKRSNSCGGRGVYRISSTPEGTLAIDHAVDGTQEFVSFSKLFMYLTRDGAETILLMRYLPRVTEGDKRIVVVDGKIFGMYLRTSPSGHWVQNVSFGGGCELIPVESEDQRIVEATHRHYKQAGIHLLGYDLLRDDDGSWKVSEINAGNIGGLFRIEYLGVTGVTDRFVDWLHAFCRENGGGEEQTTSPATPLYH